MKILHAWKIFLKETPWKFEFSTCRTKLYKLLRIMIHLITNLKDLSLQLDTLTEKIKWYHCLSTLIDKMWGRIIEQREDYFLE